MRMKDTAELQLSFFVEETTAPSGSMPRFGKRVVISSSQEDVLVGITGWDDTSIGAGILDETPSQEKYAENYSQSSFDRVFDVTGSSLCSGPSQEAVELVSPTDMRFPSLKTREGSCKQAFESEKSQSPRRTEVPIPSDMCFPSLKTTLNVALEGREGSCKQAFDSERSQSCSLPAAAANCCDGGLKFTATSSTLNAAAVEEVGKLPLESELSNRSSVIRPEAAGIAIGVRIELDREVLATDERFGRGESPANRGGGGSKRTAGCEAHQHVSAIGIGLVPRQGSSLSTDSPAWKPSASAGKGFGSGSASAFKSLLEHDSQSDFQPAVSSQHRNEHGLEFATSVRSDDNVCVLGQTACTVQINMLVLDKMDVVADDNLGKGVKSGYKSEKRRFRVQQVDTVEREREGAAKVSKVSTVESGNSLAADHCEGGKEFLSWQEQSREPLPSLTPSTGAMAAASIVGNTEAAAVAACATEGGGQCSLSSPPRPPSAVQVNLDYFKNQGGSKRPRGESFNLLEEKLRLEREMVSASTVLEVVRLRSGERPATITVADLLKTALDVGITLPPPFRRNYFSP